MVPFKVRLAHAIQITLLTPSRCPLEYVAIRSELVSRPWESDLPINITKGYLYAWVALPGRGRSPSGDEYCYAGTSSISMISTASSISRPSTGH